MNPTRSQYILPEGSARRFSPEEELAVEKATNKIFPSMLQSEGTPALDTLSSAKAAGVGAGAGVLAASAGIGKLLGSTAKGTIAGLPLAILAGLIAAERKHSKNMDTIDVIRRYPPSSVVSVRDLNAAKPVSAKMVYGKGSTSSDDFR